MGDIVDTSNNAIMTAIFIVPAEVQAVKRILDNDGQAAASLPPAARALYAQSRLIHNTAPPFSGSEGKSGRSSWRATDKPTFT